MRTPSCIENCPITDSVVEIRFRTELFQSAVFGVLYNVLKDDFPTVEKLPILQIPEALIQSDPSLRYKAHYKLTNTSNYSVQIGPEVIVIGSAIPYKGWKTEYQRIVIGVLNKIFSANVIQTVDRLGIRVINFFDYDISNGVKLKLELGDFKEELLNTTIRTQVDLDGFSNTIQLAKNVQLQTGDSIKSGYLIDIDTYKDYSDNSFITDYSGQIEQGHNIEKGLFFSILTDDFIKTLNPTYE